MSTTYYQMHREERKKYQLEHYRKSKSILARRRQLEKELLPAKAEKQRKYQNEYYQKNKLRISEQRRKAYLAKNPNAQSRPNTPQA
jgi:hypothetical protein